MRWVCGEECEVKVEGGVLRRRRRGSAFVVEMKSLRAKRLWRQKSEFDPSTKTAAAVRPVWSD